MRYRRIGNQTNSTLGSLAWKFAERISAQLVSTVVTIILARILTPTDYGVVATVTVMITICNAFVTGGLGNALIQKKDADEMDFSCIFFMGLALALGLYVVMYYIAVPVADFFGNLQLVTIIRVMSVQLPFAAANSVQQAHISRKMQFRKFFISTSVGTVISACIGISMALNGYGLWALVSQYLSNVIINTIVLFFVGGWTPRLMFSFQRAQKILPYGAKMMGAHLLDTIFNEIRSIVISAKYTPVDLAMYDNGRKYPNLLVNNINVSIGSVMFPVLSKEQSNKRKLKDIMKKSVKMSCFILVPMLMGLFACAERFVDVILTSKWDSCIPYIRITCVMCMFYPIHTINIQALNAIGESGKTLYLEGVKKGLGLLVLLITMQFGVLWIALGAMVVSLFSTYINAIYSKSMFDYSFAEQIADVILVFTLAIVMAFSVWGIDHLIPMNGILALLVDILFGASFYLAGAAILQFEMIGDITGIVVRAINHRASRGDVDE